MLRIDQEKRTVEQMIRLYCRKKEGNKTLCQQCREMLEYAHARLPFRREEGHLQALHGALLQARDERADEGGDEMGRAENDIVSPEGGNLACVAGIYKYHKVLETVLILF